MQNKELRGLPGGPNEIPVYTTGVFSTEGFRMDSPDVNNEVNIIPSGSITMKEKDGSPLRKGPIHGVDNLGNEQVMYPGFDYQFPGTEVTETLLAQTGYEVPKRRGVRLNYDDKGNVVSESTHIMATETDGKGNWFSFPTLFQNSIPYADDSKNWVDMSDRPWKEAYEEAKKRNEVIEFGKDKEAAIKFGEGSWKPKMKLGGGLLDKTVKCGNCGWEWKAADGGSDVMDCHKCGGKGLVKAQKGKETEDTSWTAYLNPANWGTSRYDDSGTFKEAFRAARNEGDSDFLWKGTRYTTELKDAPTTTAKPSAPKGITPELLVRQAYRESTFNPKAVSPAGYKGLGQIGDQVIKDYKKANNITGTIDPFNMKQNSDVHKYSMNELYNSSFINKPGQSEQVRLAKTLAAYNWGRGNVAGLLNDLKEDGVDIYNSLDWVNKLPKESRNYINDILLQKNTTFNTDFSKALSNQKNKPITKLYGFRNGGESKLGPLMQAYTRLTIEKKMGGAIANKKELGGQLNSGNITMYKDYVKGNIGNEEQAIKNYDKLNRIYYTKAKELGMSASNYIMTYIVGNS